VRDSIHALPHLRHHLLVGGDSDVELARAQTGAERVDLLPSLVRRVDPARDAAALAVLWRRVRRGGYAMVVTHQSKAGVLARSVAAATGVPAVHSLSMASFGPGYGRPENAVFTRLERFLGRRTAALCVVGADLAGRFADLGVPADRLHVVRSGIPLPGSVRPRGEARHLLHDRHGTVPGRPLVCYVGSLEPRKNPLLLVELLDRLHRRLPDPPDLLLVGDGPERERVLTALRDRGLERHAVLTGYLAEPGLVYDALRASDVFVLLSEAEGLPQVLVQAAAVGTPFVAFDVEGVREMLALGAAGTAVPLGDLDGVVEAVASHLTARLARTTTPTADLSSWSPATIASGYRAVVDRVLGASGSDRRRVRIPQPRQVTLATTAETADTGARTA
jgi:glycosyltransferase involved in cell wall biosynthesis